LAANDCIVHPSAKVHPDAVLGPNVVIGPDCTIEAGVKISNSTVFGGTTIKAHSFIEGSIIGWKNTVKEWCRITNLTCTGEDVQIGQTSCLSGVKILPHKGVNGELRD
jgi:mannose-1-phosphate guanylyltransferase